MSRQIIFISHGGGPMPLLGDPGHAPLVETLQQLSQTLRRPKQIVVFSAHWESEAIAVTSSAKPTLLYDYYGFPPESYQLQYPCPGAPELAETIVGLLSGKGINAVRDDQRGLDHGVFVPLMLMYPEADIPVVQVSLSSTLSAAEHIRLGEALAELDGEDVLFIGSGFSYHNMRGFFTDSPDIRKANADFEAWLDDTLLDASLAAEDVRQRLLNWSSAPGARACHPREEHLLPLHVCYGLTGRPADRNEKISIYNKQAANFVWG